MAHFTLTEDQHDRAIGCILAAAVGDALGASYTFQSPWTGDVEMCASPVGPWKRGEWTDDTSMTVPVLEALTLGMDPLLKHVQGRAARRWVAWSLWAPDIGNTTSVVLCSVADAYNVEDPDVPDAQVAEACTCAAETHVANASREAGRATWSGNASLMRTHALALAYLHPEASTHELAHAARAWSSLTHADHDARDACVLLTLAVRAAILTGTPDLRVGLPLLGATRRSVWERRIAAVEGKHPREVDMNAWSVGALQAAWAAITYERDRDSASNILQRTLETAVRAGGDTDTVANIAGALAGAAYGFSALPRAWVKDIFGWPGLRAPGLRDLAERVLLLHSNLHNAKARELIVAAREEGSGARVGGNVDAAVHEQPQPQEGRDGAPDLSGQPAWSDPPPAYEA